MRDKRKTFQERRQTQAAEGRLRARTWQRFLRGPDPELLERLYVPALTEAVRYDRCCSYFSSTVLAAAARGFGKLIERLEALGERAPRPAARLVVNEELAAEDVRAMMDTGDVSKLEAALLRRFKTPREALEKKRLAMLGWLVKRGLLAVRVAVMRQGAGIVHAKFGLMTDDAGDAVVFSGSGNESAAGLRANYERLEVSTSWADPERHREYADEFERLWANEHPDVFTVSLPEALRLKLVKFAPPEAPVGEPRLALARQKAGMIWRFICESPYLPNGGPACDATALVDLWPHQRRVVEDVAAAWPEGRLLCDEVGMGKTIEAILALRRLMAGRGVRRALILLPAGLLKQWQAELREKGGMVFPRLEGLATLVWPDERREKLSGLAEALERDVLLMSRETARTGNNLPAVLAAKPWDLVLLDEAHAARRREQEEGESNSGNLLLDLLRNLQLRRKTRGILLLSATPMQIHPWEPWDLLGVLGEGGRWLAEFGGVRDFYEAVARVQQGRCDLETARKAAAMIASDPQFPNAGDSPPTGDAIARRMAFTTSGQRPEVARWLRGGSPLGRRMFRNTRTALRRYHEMGLLPDPPPQRDIADILFDYADADERRLYDAVGDYIKRRYEKLEGEKPGKGFVMTVYRRRVASSPLAIERSLARRREGLLRVIGRRAYDPDMADRDAPEGLDPSERPEGETVGKVSMSLPTDLQEARAELAEVERVMDDLRRLGDRDSKRDQFFSVLRQITDDGRSVLVFTEYTDTMEYLRDRLVEHYGKGLGCYSGDGGQVWDGQEWRRVTKDVITEALRKGQLRVLLCTDAASEGLNLQAAGAVVNYDLPWNPSKVEQRIGRIDRIGQKLPHVRVVNLFLEESVDEKVYRALKARCGLFEHFVGAMQPVLARARRMLLGQEPLDLATLEATAHQVEQDPLAAESYVESEATSEPAQPAAVSRPQLETALAYLHGDFGYRVKSDRNSGTHVVSGTDFPKASFSCRIGALERDERVLPLSPFEPRVRELVERLSRPGEMLPLVIGSHEKGAFRSSVAYWIGEGKGERLNSLDELMQHVEAWDGTCSGHDLVLKAQRKARGEARKQVELMAERATAREAAGLQRQTDAARIRLQCELGRFLLCLDEGAADLNQTWRAEMAKGTATGQRLERCYQQLGGYPVWDVELVREVRSLVEQLTENHRKARIAGKELDAALDDPRWQGKLPRGL